MRVIQNVGYIFLLVYSEIERKLEIQRTKVKLFGIYKCVGLRYEALRGVGDANKIFASCADVIHIKSTRKCSFTSVSFLQICIYIL